MWLHAAVVEETVGADNDMKRKNEFERFANLVARVLKVPHSELKAKLDAEKKAKKRKKARKSSAVARERV